MKILHPAQSFETLLSFYADDETRWRSVERDYGVHWTEASHPRGPKHRVSLVLATHELYDVAYSVREMGSTRLLAIFDDNDQAERALDGWAEHCGPEGLRWLDRRLESLIATWYCTVCNRIGVTEITTDPTKRCTRNSTHRHWEPTPETRLNSDFRRAVLGARPKRKESA